MTESVKQDLRRTSVEDPGMKRGLVRVKEVDDGGMVGTWVHRVGRGEVGQA